MPYAELIFMVAGAEEERHEFSDETLITEYLNTLEREASEGGYRYEVYRLDHDHEPGIECECIQFAQDHRPYRVFNPEGND